MDVLVASSPHRDTFGYSMPPPGLLRLGGELQRHGHRVRLDDLAFRLANGELEDGDFLCAAAARRLLAAGPPEVLGLSTMGATLPAALEIARVVRAEAPETVLVLGGPGTHGIDVPLVERFPQVDLVLRGEGEVTFPAALDRIRERGRPLEMTGVAGATWRTPSGDVRREADRAPLQDLDRLADYAWSLLPPLASYKALTGESEGLTPIDSGRGCVYDCSFCTIGRFWSRRSRPLPVERLVREVCALREIEGARNAYLCHDIFGADRRHAEDFCNAMIARGAPVPWECRARIDHVDEALAALMGRAGCYRVLFGIESGDRALRNAHDKHLAEPIDVDARIEACVRNGITPILSLILGLPGEDPAALSETLDLAARSALVGGVQISLHLVNPQPGCRLGDEHAADSRPVEGIAPDMAFGAGTTAPEAALIAAHPDLFSTWALLTGLPGGEPRLRALHVAAETLPELLMRYPRTFATLRRRSGADPVALFTEWQATGRSFAAFVRARRDPLLADVLRWEEAIVRAGARRTPSAVAAVATVVGRPGPTLPRSLAEVLELGFEPAALSRWLRGVADAPPAATVAVAVHPGAGRAGRIATTRVTADVALVLGALDGTTSLEDLERRTPGIRSALVPLVERGLVEL